MTGVDKHKLKRANKALSGLRSVPNFRVRVSRGRFTTVIGRGGITIVKRSNGLYPTSGGLCTLQSIAKAIGSLPLVTDSVVYGGVTTKTSTVILSIGAKTNTFVGARRSTGTLTRTVIGVNGLTNHGAVTVVSSVDRPLKMTIKGTLRIRITVRALGNGKPGSLRTLYVRLKDRVICLNKGSTSLTRTHRLMARGLHGNGTLRGFGIFITSRKKGPTMISSCSLVPRTSHRRSILTRTSKCIARVITSSVNITTVLLNTKHTAGRDVVSLTTKLGVLGGINSPIRGNRTVIEVFTGGTSFNPTRGLVRRTCSVNSREGRVALVRNVVAS